MTSSRTSEGSGSIENTLAINIMKIIGRPTSDTLKSLQFNTMTLEQAYPDGGGALGEEMPQIGEDPGGYPGQARILYWYHPDYIQNVDLVTDLDGQAYELFLYNPWGEQLHHWSSNSSSWTSPYRFNAKEVDPETGLAYYGARYYQNKIGVWLSVDPKAADAPGWTAYNVMWNNPLKFVDPDGQWAFDHIDVTKNDDGTYKVVGGQANSDKNIYVVDGNGKRTGEVVGEMLTEYSFHGDDGNAVVGAVIDQSDNSGQNFFNNEIKNVGLIEYMGNAKGGEPLDFKTRDIPNGLTRQGETQYSYRGMSFNGKIASARDIGNYSAGYVTGVNGFNWNSSRFAFDALETKQAKGTWNTVLYYPFNRVSEGQPSQQAQRAGHNEGYSIFNQRQFEREWRKATNPYPTGAK